LQLLETENSELKKMMDESYSASRISANKGQLKKAVTFDTLTTEILLRFIEKIKFQVPAYDTIPTNHYNYIFIRSGLGIYLNI
jgi:hypothetical protein